MDWSKMGQEVSDWLSKPQSSILLGNAAAALMGPQQDSWQAQLGKAGSGYAQSSIANAAAKAKQAKDDEFRKMFINLLAGMPGTGIGLTPEGVAGDTTVTMQQNADGTYTRTVKGNKQATQPTGGEAERMAPTKAPAPTFQSNIAGQKVPFDPSMVPLY